MDLQSHNKEVITRLTRLETLFENVDKAFIRGSARMDRLDLRLDGHGTKIHATDRKVWGIIGVGIAGSALLGFADKFKAFFGS